jgi:ubiquinone/menaquinone biosynthesis C-methylase UbiE
MMLRVPEPEVMDAAGQADAYAAADFAEVNGRFAAAVLERHPALARGRLLDLGCGPADIPIRIARLAPEARVTAVDASSTMMALARKAVAAAGLESRVGLLLAHLPGLPLPERSFDGVVSNSLLHHLPEPDAFWTEVLRLARPGAAVHVTDLLRPDSPERARALVETYSAKEHPILKEDFYNSLRAAFTLEEVAAQLARAGLGAALAPSRISDRHWEVSGRLP